MILKPAAAKWAVLWLLPPLVCLALYWNGLRAWFQADDFAWLSLHTQVTDYRSFLSALFRPMAQGTVRPLSERLFFLSFWELFGMDARPYRVLVFLTQFANLALVISIARKLTRSGLAAVSASILWLVCPAIYLPMVWTSAYNQVLCAFFLLSALWLLMRYTETGQRRFYIGMWLAFLVGFGALESNVVFPAIALLYTLLFARRYAIAVLPLFAVSLGYIIWHRSAASSIVDSTYAMTFNPVRMIGVVGEYIWYAASAQPTIRTLQLPAAWFNAATVFALAAVTAFLFVMLWKRSAVALFCAGWFFITLAPYVPFANHVSDYYLTIPVIGLAMLAGWGVSLAIDSAAAWKKVVAGVAVLSFAIPGVMQARTQTGWYAAQSRRIREVMRGLATVHSRFPDRYVVLQGVDDDLFWNALSDRPERALGWTPIYLTPETRPAISPVRSDDISSHFLPASVLVAAVRDGRAVVYDASAGPLRNITSIYGPMRAQHSDASELPVSVDAGNPLFAHLLQSGWYELGPGFRWTSKKAELQIHGPTQNLTRLQITGRVAEEHTKKQPLNVTVFVDEGSVGSQAIPKGQTEFQFTYALPEDAWNKPVIRVGLEVERTVSTRQDARAYGLAMGTVALIP